jgi:uridine kinase
MYGDLIPLASLSQILADRFSEQARSRRYLAIAVSGDGGLGKSTFCALVTQRNPKIRTLSVDGYIPSRAQRGSEQLPLGDELADYSAVRRAVASFKAGKGVSNLRSYDHVSGQPTDLGLSFDADTNILLIDGGLASIYLPKPFLDYYVLFDAPDDVRRAIRREVDISRGYTTQQFEVNWKAYLSIYQRTIATQRDAANVIACLTEHRLYNLIEMREGFCHGPSDTESNVMR